MMNKKTAQWISLTNEVLENFLYNYFDDNNPYYFWVGDEIGGVVCYGGFFFRFLDVIACNKLKVSRPQFLNWYFHLRTFIRHFRIFRNKSFIRKRCDLS